MRAALLVAAIAGLTVVGCGTTVVSSALRAIDSEPDLVSINREAQLAYESGEAAKAEALYKSLVRRMPNDAETWFRLGNLYARNNRPDEAAGAYQRALLANSSDARIWNNLAVVRLRQGWAALLQAQAHSKDDTPLATQVDTNLDHLSKLPVLEGESRQVDPAMGTGRY
jgi:tetratricopeptide (TPR) repeat protein